MAAYSCQPCTVNWPNLAGEFKKCPLCGEGTDYSYIKSPDYTAEEAREYVRERRARERAIEDARTDASKEHADRVDRYLKMKFSEVGAERLAVAKWTEYDSKRRAWVRPLDPDRVARALASGCSHELVLEIFA